MQRDWPRKCFYEGVREEARTDIGTRVGFSARHIFLPNQEEAGRWIDPNEEYVGVITGFSDSGEARRAYAVVEVIRRLSFVVSVPNLRLISEPDRSGLDHE